MDLINKERMSFMKLSLSRKANLEGMLIGDQVTIGGPAVEENIRFEVLRNESGFEIKVFDRLEKWLACSRVQVDMYANN
ncbi:hypothetical protein MMB75_01880 [Paenibacillus sp. P2(2022)]|uniref:hypothetical protein n=2 Tax=Paenibacillus TaxID=44249 RepID=UPI0008D74EE1|nr:MULTISPECIES: hypothetical protein [Paenibacillus]MDG0052414.1 hypothetical protein [Paenibacillus sp. P2(2022)]MEB4782722.1 hypothetical protein [Paenibacillus jamilae]SEJ54267.1 hypothetical protein SAMN04488600_103216 [Paenibacillus polymyxa]